MDRSITGATTQRLGENRDRDPNVERKLEGAGQPRRRQDVAAGPGNDGPGVEDQALRRRLRLAMLRPGHALRARFSSAAGTGPNSTSISASKARSRSCWSLMRSASL